MALSVRARKWRELTFMKFELPPPPIGQLTEHSKPVNPTQFTNTWATLYLPQNDETDIFRLEPGVLETASDLVQRGAHRDIVDYDNHLDDLAKDFLNVELNEAYDI